ncbi:helix-turn-helix domain-containing protein [Pseudomonas sp. GM60]|uniref:helix-turn-helix domain-containing protein n=1 Tax=Pseudomonas sp. GM60 TaxID=1144334 RepID=UPI0005187532
MGVQVAQRRPATLNRIKLIQTSFQNDTASPNQYIPTMAVPAAPIPVQTAKRFLRAAPATPSSTFARTFKAETGSSPAEFVELARIDEARRLIEGSDVSLKRLADTVGYANRDGFRRAFMRRLGVGPSDYRKRFSTV